MEDKKKRTGNFSNNEKKVLSELVMKYKEIVECKRTDASTNKNKTAGWIRLAQEFNNISSECYRTASNLKTCWENIKRMSKKEVSCRKKEIFMTGGGRPKPFPDDSATVIVEAVLGPALEGLTNDYDGDGPSYHEITTSTDEARKKNSESVTSDENSNMIILSALEEKRQSQDEPEPGTSKMAEKQPQHVKELWESWTPTSLKRPIAQPLQPNNTGDDWSKRRRPKAGCSADTLLKEKIELVKILKKNAAEEGDLRILILQEQLKQEKIKTAKLCAD